MLFTIGDYLAGMLIGAATAWAVHAIVWPGMDMVIAMMIGMAVGMILHVLVGLLLAPMLGMPQTIVPASLIGMYGGMLFGMRDSMAAGSGSYGATAVVGATLGAAVVFGVKVYDRALRGAVVDAA
jgi:hypothetical protein